MVRSFQATTLVAPIPGPVHQKISEHQKSQMLSAAYLEVRSGGCFLDYARTHLIGKDGKVKQRLFGQGHAAGKETMAVGVKFHYEMLDIYHGEYGCVFLPHASRSALYPEKAPCEYTRFYCGVLEYLMSLTYSAGTDDRELLADPIYDPGGKLMLARRVAKVRRGARRTIVGSQTDLQERHTQNPTCDYPYASCRDLGPLL